MNKIPKFKTEKEEAKFWDTHDSTQFLGQLKEAANIKFPKPRHKSVIVDLEPQYVEAIKKIAHKKHLPYHTIIQRWLKEKVCAEK